ncbi:hypothetical protein OPT61_g3534 [Boeremia exigua]|uniref:Uncharacterized protein n=1 Tax=Boeremia exigua TaxID=749465 RepID=A0ACC2IHH7_9PLEO|nr:hypothetical protein OPT61_g3534 [Boeremia exigua]
MDNIQFEAKQLVRSYSHKHHGGDDGDGSDSRQKLDRALEDQVIQEDAFAMLVQRALSSRSTSTAAKSRCEELKAAISSFQKTFSGQLTVEGHQKMVSWSSINAGLKQLQSKYIEKSNETVRGKSKQRFHRLCEMIHDHSGVLKVLPQEYAAPVTASVELIVKASVNHEQIGEDFAGALEDIDRIVDSVERWLALFPGDPRLQEMAAQLCCAILDFVTVPMKWYSESGGKRLKTSLNENATQQYQKYVDKIRRIADHIREAAELSTIEDQRRDQAANRERNMEFEARVVNTFRQWQIDQQRDHWRRDESRYIEMHRALEKMDRTIRENPQNSLLMMSKMIGHLSHNELGPPIKQILHSGAVRFIAAETSRSDRPSNSITMDDLSDDEGRSMKGPELSNILRSRAEVQEAAQALDDHFDYDRIAPTAFPTSDFVEAEILQRLQQWTSQANPSMLGIIGPGSLSEENPFQLLTASYVQAAKASNLACLSYFCRIRPSPGNREQSDEAVASVELLYALIRQLMIYLPIDLPLEPVLHRSRFDDLDGTLCTWDIGLTLFQDLFKLVQTPVLLVSVYGIELLDSSRTVTHLEALLDVLRTCMSTQDRAGGLDTVVKVLLVTSGISQALYSRLQVEEICDVNRGSAARSPWKTGKGRQNMSFLDFSGL